MKRTEGNYAGVREFIHLGRSFPHLLMQGEQSSAFVSIS